MQLFNTVLLQPTQPFLRLYPRSPLRTKVGKVTLILLPQACNLGRRQWRAHRHRREPTGPVSIPFASRSIVGILQGLETELLRLLLLVFVLVLLGGNG